MVEPSKFIVWEIFLSQSTVSNPQGSRQVIWANQLSIIAFEFLYICRWRPIYHILCQYFIERVLWYSRKFRRWGRESEEQYFRTCLAMPRGQLGKGCPIYVVITGSQEVFHCLIICILYSAYKSLRWWMFTHIWLFSYFDSYYELIMNIITNIQ